MNGREMFRQTSAKQTNAQATQASQPNKQLVEIVGRRSLPKSEKAALAATTTTPKTTPIKKQLNTQCNLQISQEFEFIHFGYTNNQKYPKQNMCKTLKFDKE